MDAMPYELKGRVRTLTPEIQTTVEEVELT